MTSEALNGNGPEFDPRRNADEVEDRRQAAINAYRGLMLASHTLMVPAGVKSVMDRIPRWNFEISGPQRSETTHFERELPEGYSFAALLRHKSFRPKVEEGRLKITLHGRPRARDLMAVLGVEIANWKHSVFTFPEAEEEVDDSTDYDEARNDFFSEPEHLFTPRQQLALQAIADTGGQHRAEKKYGKGKNTFYALLKKAKTAYEAEKLDDLIVLAYLNGEINLDELPDNATSNLNDFQKDLIRNTFDFDLEARREFRKSPEHNRHYNWRVIYQKCGLKIDNNNRYILHLLAAKDGLIEVDDMQKYLGQRPELSS